MKEKELRKVWEKLTYKQKLAATAIIFETICEHARKGGTFRYLIYNRLGFDIDSYALLYNAGGINISNEFKLD